MTSSARQYPIVTVIGPRQAGKSTLCRMVFSGHAYASLEDPDLRVLASEDARRFLALYPRDLIIDEIQRVPDLLSYIQTLVDAPDNKRHFVLTGSQQLLLMEKVTQTLAGRTVIAKLFPFSKKEIEQGNPKRASAMCLEEFIFTGGYPRIYDKDLDPRQWLQQYYQTYVERDVRTLINVGDLESFQKFVRLCAGRVGNLINYASLANDCGISQPTAKAWFSVLKASFICFFLLPHFKNFSKRLIKASKLYFYDTGLLCYLLRITDPQMLLQHPMRGAIFENWVLSETLKKFYNQGLEPPAYYWRDTKGHEVDLIIDEGERLYPVEIKSGQTFHSDFVSDLDYFNTLQFPQDTQRRTGECIYAGDMAPGFREYKITSWKSL